MLSFIVLQREQMIKKGRKAYEGVILLIAFRVFLYRLKTLQHLKTGCKIDIGKQQQ